LNLIQQYKGKDKVGPVLS